MFTGVQRLLDNIRSRSLSLVMVGCGRVGLPTAALFADAGFHVIVFDLNPKVVEAINNGVSHINEPHLGELVSRSVRSGKLRATLNLEDFTGIDSVIISVQTPVEKKRPNLSFLMKAVESVGKILKKGMIVVIVSTVPPGTMLGKIKPAFEHLSGLKAEEDFFLAYAPERMAPGKALEELLENPRLIGGIGPNSTRIVSELFRVICKRVIETNVITAEIAKLAENTYRDINIAFANQLALICEQHGADVKKVIELANTHPRVNIHAPGPGVGGPCLTKDPYFLIYGLNFPNKDLVSIARKINDYMPEYVVRLTVKALEKAGKSLKGSKISILGTAYKAEVDDPRESPSKYIIRKLIKLGARVVAFDPYCRESFGAERAESIWQALEGADCMVIVTDHKEFRNLNLQETRTLMNISPSIVDGRRIINPDEAEKLGFIYYGIGFGLRC